MGFYFLFFWSWRYWFDLVFKWYLYSNNTDWKICNMRTWFLNKKTRRVELLRAEWVFLKTWLTIIKLILIDFGFLLAWKQDRKRISSQLLINWMLKYSRRIDITCWFSPIVMIWDKKKAEWFWNSLFQDCKEESSDKHSNYFRWMVFDGLIVDGFEFCTWMILTLMEN